MRIQYANEWGRGLFFCKDCEHEWAAELPPLWWPDWPSCPECDAEAKLLEPAAE